MVISVFAKKGTSADGKKFDRYIGKLHRADGSELNVSIKFREECGKPKPGDCPVNIIVDKTDANLSPRTYVREDSGETVIAYTLWVSKWKLGEKFVDHSLDDFTD